MADHDLSISSLGESDSKTKPSNSLFGELTQLGNNPNEDYLVGSPVNQKQSQTFTLEDSITSPLPTLHDQDDLVASPAVETPVKQDEVIQSENKEQQIGLGDKIILDADKQVNEIKAETQVQVEQVVEQVIESKTKADLEESSVKEVQPESELQTNDSNLIEANTKAIETEEVVNRKPEVEEQSAPVVETVTNETNQPASEESQVIAEVVEEKKEQTTGAEPIDAAIVASNEVESKKEPQESSVVEVHEATEDVNQAQKVKDESNDVVGEKEEILNNQELDQPVAQTEQVEEAQEDKHVEQKESTDPLVEEREASQVQINHEEPEIKEVAEQAAESSVEQGAPATESAELTVEKNTEEEAVKNEEQGGIVEPALKENTEEEAVNNNEEVPVVEVEEIQSENKEQIDATLAQAETVPPIVEEGDAHVESEQAIVTETTEHEQIVLSSIQISEADSAAKQDNVETMELLTTEAEESSVFVSHTTLTGLQTQAQQDDVQNNTLEQVKEVESVVPPTENQQPGDVKDQLVASVEPVSEQVIERVEEVDIKKQVDESNLLIDEAIVQNVESVDNVEQQGEKEQILEQVEVVPSETEHAILEDKEEKNQQPLEESVKAEVEHPVEAVQQQPVEPIAEQVVEVISESQEGEVAVASAKVDEISQEENVEVVETENQEEVHDQEIEKQTPVTVPQSQDESVSHVVDEQVQDQEKPVEEQVQLVVAEPEEKPEVVQDSMSQVIETQDRIEIPEQPAQPVQEEQHPIAEIVSDSVQKVVEDSKQTEVLEISTEPVLEEQKRDEGDKEKTEAIEEQKPILEAGEIHELVQEPAEQTTKLIQSVPEQLENEQTGQQQEITEEQSLQSGIIDAPEEIVAHIDAQDQEQVTEQIITQPEANAEVVEEPKQVEVEPVQNSEPVDEIPSSVPVQEEEEQPAIVQKTELADEQREPSEKQNEATEVEQQIPVVEEADASVVRQQEQQSDETELRADDQQEKQAEEEEEQPVPLEEANQAAPKQEDQAINEEAFPEAQDDADDGLSQKSNEKADRENEIEDLVEDFNDDALHISSAAPRAEDSKQSGVHVQFMDSGFVQQNDGEEGEEELQQNDSPQNTKNEEENDQESIEDIRLRLQQRQEGLVLREMQLDALEKQLNEASEHIQLQRHDLHEKIEEAKKIKERENFIEKKEEALSQREASLATQIEYLKEQDIFVTGKEQAISERETAIAAKEEEIKNLLNQQSASQVNQEEEASAAARESELAKEKESELQALITELQNRLQEAINEASIASSQSSQAIQKLTDELEAQKEKTKAEQEERTRIESELTLIQAEIAQKLNQNNQQQSESQLNDQADQLKNAEEQLALLNIEKQAQQDRITTLEAELEGLKSQEQARSEENKEEDLEKQVQDLLQQQNQLQQDLDKKNEAIEGQKNDLARLQKQLDEQDMSLRRNVAEKTALETRMESIRKESAEEIMRLKLASEDIGDNNSNLRGSARKNSTNSITSSGRKIIPQALVENSNYETIIADLRDTINMLNKKCDDYEIQIENYQRQNNQLVSSLREIRNSIGQNQGLEDEVETQKFKVKQLMRRIEESEKTREIENKQTARYRGELDFYLLENKKLLQQNEECFAETRELNNVIIELQGVNESINHQRTSLLGENEILLKDIVMLRDLVRSTQDALTASNEAIVEERLARDARFQDQLVEWNTQRLEFEDQSIALAGECREKQVELDSLKRLIEQERLENSYQTRKQVDSIESENRRQIEVLRESLGLSEAEKVELVNQLQRVQRDLEIRLNSAREDSLYLKEKNQAELQQAKDELTLLKFSTKKQIDDLNTYIAQQKIALQNQLQDSVSQQNQDSQYIDSIQREMRNKDNSIEQLEREVGLLKEDKASLFEQLLSERQAASQELELKLLEFSQQLDAAKNQTHQEANLTASRLSSRYEIELDTLKAKLSQSASTCSSQELLIADQTATIEQLQKLVMAKKNELEKVVIEIDTYKSQQNLQSINAQQDYSAKIANIQKEADKTRVDYNEAEHARRELQIELERQAHTVASLESKLDSLQQALDESQAKNSNNVREMQYLSDQKELAGEKQRQVLQQTINQQENEIDGLIQKQQLLIGDNNKIRSQNGELIAIKRELEDQLANKDVAHLAIQGETSKVEEILSNAKFELDETRKLCLQYKQDLAVEKDNVAKRGQELGEVLRENNSLKDENARLKAAEDETAQQRLQIQDLEQQLTDLIATHQDVLHKLNISDQQETASRKLSIEVRDVLEKTEEDLKYLQNENEQLQNTLANKQTQIAEERVQMIRQYENLRKEYEVLSLDKEQAVADNQELTKMIEEFQSDQSGRASAQLQSAEAYIEDQAHQIQSLEESLSAANKKVNLLEEQNSQIEKLYVSVKENEQQKDNEKVKLQRELEEARKQQQSGSDVDAIKSLLHSKERENISLQEQLLSLKPQETALRQQLYEKEQQLLQFNSYMNDHIRQQQSKDEEISTLRDMLLEKNQQVDEQTASVRHLSDELAHLKAAFLDQVENSISDQILAKDQELQEQQGLIKKLSDEQSEFQRIISSQREALLRAQQRETELERELSRKNITRDDSNNRQNGEHLSDKESKLLDDIKQTNQAIHNNFDRVLKDREDTRPSPLLDAASKPNGMKVSDILPPRTIGLGSARAQKDNGHQLVLASPAQLRNEDAVKKSQPVISHSFTRSSPMASSATVSITSSAYNPQSTAILDQAYLKCIQRSRNLLSKNETILNSLKQSNSSVDRSIRNPSPSSAITVQPILANNHNHLISSSYRGSSTGGVAAQGYQKKPEQQQRASFLANPPVPTNLSNPSTLLNQSSYTQSRLMNTSATYQQKRPPVIDQRNRTFSTDQPQSDLASRDLSTAMINNSAASGLVSNNYSNTTNNLNKSAYPASRTRSISNIGSSAGQQTQQPEAARYEGEKLGNLRHGRGRSFYPNGEMYEGEWKSDKRHGYGILKDASGEIYNGDWEFDQFHGQGRLRNKNGDVLTQEFDFKNFAGLKNYWFSYSGEFKNNCFNGLGTLILTNGEKFLGSFAGGKIHGEGTFYRLSGDIEVGHWQNNRYIGKL